jgi:hypothetical protein
MRYADGIVKNGMIELSALPDWPDGTPVTVRLLAECEDDDFPQAIVVESNPSGGGADSRR